MDKILPLAVTTQILSRRVADELTETFTTYAPIAKSYGLAGVHRVRRAVVLMAEFYDAKWPVENPQCDKSILCLHEGKHKKGCFAYTVPITKYSRDISRG